MSDFSHSLSPEPTWLAMFALRSARKVMSRSSWLPVHGLAAQARELEQVVNQNSQRQLVLTTSPHKHRRLLRNVRGDGQLGKMPMLVPLNEIKGVNFLIRNGA